MTIKEIEERSGMARANIRFYEKEGLISPVRQENGYRDYSEKDLEDLEKIKLLRALDLSVEAIREAKAGKQSLTDLLEAHLPHLRQETQRLQAAQETCQKMCRDGVSYENLRAEQYLHELSGFPAETKDRIPVVKSPWRRYFARSLDLSVYGVFVYIVMAIVTPYSIIRNTPLFRNIMSYLAFGIMLLVEPLLLHWFGTTFGKWVLGLCVNNQDSEKLSYAEALSRTWEVFAVGYGYNLPIYSLYCLWRSYRDCKGGEEQTWESESVVELKDERTYRTVACVVAYVLTCIITAVLPAKIAIMPPHRGPLTMAEYTENFNYFAYLSNLSDLFALDAQGDWVESDENAPIIVVGNGEQPRYEYTMTDGCLTGIRFHLLSHQSEDVGSSYMWEKLIPVLSYIRPRESLFSSNTDAIVQQIVSHGTENWEIERNGVTVSNEVTIRGYTVGGNILLPNEGEAQTYEVIFSISLDQ